MFEGFQDMGPVFGAGIYVLCFNGRVVYVGKSRKMLNRIYTHRLLWDRLRSGKPMPSSGPYSAVRAYRFDQVYIMPCAIIDLDRLEREMISRFKPKENIHFAKLAKAPRPTEDVSKILSILIPPKTGTPGFVRRI